MSIIGKGNFECTALFGRGGMGEVYQAKDRKLGRDVAIKVLPEEFAKDADRVARFQREAKLLASLNHPNIAATHGLEESDGTHFLVMELVEGITLDNCIAGNAGVPAGKKAAETPALPGLPKLALQISEALEAAHEKGVIQRDLKAANIQATPDGKVVALESGRKTLLMIKPVVTAGGEPVGGTPRKINIILNWFEELKEQVPVD